MEVIVVNRILSREEENNLLEQVSAGNRKIHLFSNVALSEKLAEFSTGSIELTADEKREINYQLFDRVLNFGEINIGDVAITDILLIENASIWHYHKFRTYFFIRNLMFEIRLIEKLQKQYETIRYYGESGFLKKYPFNSSGLTLCLSQNNPSKVNFKTVLNYLIFFAIRIVFSVFQLIKIKKAKHIVIDHAIKQTCLNIHTLKPEPGNYNLEYLFEKLDHDFIILDDVDIPKFHRGSDFRLKRWHFKSKGRRLNGELILLQGILSLNLRKQLKKSSLLLSEKYDQIESNLNDPIDLIMNDFLRSLHASGKFYIFKYLSYKRFFKSHSYRSISTIDENSPRIKSILDAAKTLAIKTIGIQHGTIHELHPAFMFTLEDAKRKLVPDFTLLWGENWKKLLIEKGNYPAESLVIEGQIRTDIIPVLKPHRISGQIEVPANSKIILFASQPQQDPELRKQSGLDIFAAAKAVPATHLIVKLHPAEFNDINYYRELAIRSGCSNYQIVSEIDLYLLISLCDIVVTCFSTVGAEAVYFNKPLIILDHLRQDIQKYFIEGIAFQATNVQELKDYIVKILDNQLSVKTAVYENYIRNYAYKIDGNVSNRIVQFIKSL